MEVKKVLMLFGGTQYNVLNVFTEELAKGFCENGVDVDIADGRTGRKYVENLYFKEYDLILSFNGMWDRSVTENFMRNKNVVVWSFLVDHPLHHHLRLLSDHRRQIISCIDRKHVEYVKGYYSNNNYAVYVPHGGILAPSTKNFDDRRHDVSFFGTYNSPEEALSELDKYDDAMKTLIYRIIEILWTNPDRGIEEELSIQLENLGIAVPKDEFRNLIKELKFVDRYLRNKKRHDVIEALISHGIKVDVFGNGWEKFKTNYGYNLNMHRAIGHEESLIEMAESRIVLNTMPLFADGSHERVFTIMGAKSICFTDKNLYFAEQFKDGEELFFYTMQELYKLPEKVKSVLNKEYDVDAILERGYEIVKEKHLWRNRAQEILEYLKTINFETEEKIAVHNITDDEFNQYVQHVSTTDTNVLKEKIKAKYLFKSECQMENAQNLSKAFADYSCWGRWNPETGNFGVIDERVSEIEENVDKIIWLYNILEDETSKRVLKNVLLNWETFDGNYLNMYCGTIHKAYFDEDILKYFDKDEVFIDLGAKTGETLDIFLKKSLNQYKKIYCYEYEQHNVNLLEERIKGNEDIIVKKYGTNNQIVSLDEDVKEKITFIKCDVENSEIETLQGAKNHILNDHPKMAISVWRGNRNIWSLAEYIHQLDDTYKFYLRYYGGNLYPNEIVLYAV